MLFLFHCILTSEIFIIKYEERNISNKEQFLDKMGTLEDLAIYLLRITRSMLHFHLFILIAPE